MLRASQLFLAVFLLFFPLAASAQDVQILFPQEGQQVRGSITVRYSGIPEGGYAIIKIDGNFYTATSLSTFVLNTFPPAFAGDGTHRITVAAVNEGGKRLGEKTVSFEVSNSRVEAGGERVPLAHYGDLRLDATVDRYRVFAESNATIDLPEKEKEEGGTTAEKEKVTWMETPLDWQVGAMMRRIVRDVGLFSDAKEDGFTSANIAISVESVAQHQRDMEAPFPSPDQKAPWKGGWEAGSEAGTLSIRMTEGSGAFIEYTKLKPAPPAILDFMPTFPESQVAPGSTWESKMTFLTELSARDPLRVEAPMTFTTFESVTTPAGVKRRAAKMESRFRLKEMEAKSIANTLFAQYQAASAPVEGAPAGGGEGGGGGAPAPGGAPDAPAAEPIFGPISTNYSRIVWHDFERNRLLRSEDKAHIQFRVTLAEASTDDQGAETGPIEIGISYDMTVTTWFDDSTPAPSSKFGGPRGPITTGRDPYKAGNPTLEKAKDAKP